MASTEPREELLTHLAAATQRARSGHVPARDMTAIGIEGGVLGDWLETGQNDSRRKDTVFTAHVIDDELVLRIREASPDQPAMEWRMGKASTALELIEALTFWYEQQTSRQEQDKTS